MLSRIAALAIGAAVAVLAIFAAGQQVVVAQGNPLSRATGSGFAVLPRDQVNLYGDASIPDNGEFVLYIVPSDRVLVILPSSNGYVPLKDHTSLAGEIDLVERLNGRDTTKARVLGQSGVSPAYLGPAPSDGIGWKFRPGSLVVLKNQPGSLRQCSWSIFGYLTPL